MCYTRSNVLEPALVPHSGQWRQESPVGRYAGNLKTSEEAIDYATGYANKVGQKTVKRAFRGRFWGCSRSLTSSIVELEDISIRQLQHIRTNYLSSLVFCAQY